VSFNEIFHCGLYLRDIQKAGYAPDYFIGAGVGNGNPQPENKSVFSVYIEGRGIFYPVFTGVWAVQISHCRVKVEVCRGNNLSCIPTPGHCVLPRRCRSQTAYITSVHAVNRVRFPDTSYADNGRLRIQGGKHYIIIPIPPLISRNRFILAHY